MKRPSKAFYLISVFVAVIGIGSLIYFINGFLGSLKNLDMLEVAGPGEVELFFEETGGYGVYFETKYFDDNKLSRANPNNINGLQLNIEHKKTQQAVTVTPVDYTATFSYGSKEGVALWTFKLDQPGQYIVSTGHDDSMTTGYQLAIIHEMGKNIFRLVLYAIAGPLVFLGSMGLSLLILIIVFLKRRDVPTSTV